MEYESVVTNATVRSIVDTVVKEALEKVSNKPDGLTRREYFAAAALQGILASPKGWKNGTEEVTNAKHFAQCAVNFADCLEVELTDGDYED